MRVYYLIYWQILNMEFTTNNEISEELVNSFNEEKTYQLAKRLEDDNYLTPFD